MLQPVLPGSGHVLNSCVTLQAAQQRKLAQLAAAGVPAKFTAELARYKPFKTQQ